MANYIKILLAVIFSFSLGYFIAVHRTEPITDTHTVSISIIAEKKDCEDKGGVFYASIGSMGRDEIECISPSKVLSDIKF